MKYKFEDIAINSTAKKLPEPSDNEHYIGLEHLDSSNLYVTRWGAETAPIGEKLLMKKGDVLFGKRRAYQKKVGIAPFDGIFSAHGMVLRPKEDVICKEFFPFFISSDYFLNEAIRISVGGLSPTINWKDLRVLEFELPSLEEQRVLADKLWAAYEVKESYKNLLAQTDKLLHAQFEKMFGNAETNGTIASLVYDNIRSVKKTYKPEDTISYIDISSVDAELNEVIATTDYLVSKAPSRAQQCVQEGDILVSTTRPINKNIAVIKSKAKNLVASTGFCVLRPKEEYRAYLLAIVKSDMYTKAMCDKATGGVYPAVNNSDVLSYKIVVPSPEVLQEVTSLAEQSEKTKASLNKGIEAIEAVIRSLIAEGTTKV